MRYLKSKKNSTFLSFITFLSIFGVALGVSAMIVVLSVMDGFESQLKKRLMGTHVHILVTPSALVPGADRGFVPIESLDLTDIKAHIKDDTKILSIVPVVSTEAILKVGRKVTGVVLNGVNEEKMIDIKKMVVEEARPDQLQHTENGQVVPYAGVFIGQELAYDLGLLPGDSVSLISPTETEGPLGDVPRTKRFVVAGIYHSGMPEEELHSAYASSSSVGSFIRMNNVASKWEVAVKNFDDAPAIASEIRRAAPDFKVQDWIQLNSNLFWSLRLERISMFVIMAFIVVVASFNIVTTLTLMVLEKKREICILRAMGAREGEVAAIFLGEGLLIGGLGIGGGTILGLLACMFLRSYPIIELPDVFYDRTLPVTFDPRYYFGVAFCAAVIVLFACFYPSQRAARLDPIEGIRYG